MPQILRGFGIDSASLCSAAWPTSRASSGGRRRTARACFMALPARRLRQRRRPAHRRPASALPTEVQRLRDSLLAHSLCQPGTRTCCSCTAPITWSRRPNTSAAVLPMRRTPGRRLHWSTRPCPAIFRSVRERLALDAGAAGGARRAALSQDATTCCRACSPPACGSSSATRPARPCSKSGPSRSAPGPNC